MSGRKASEVNALLIRGKETRAAGAGNFESIINNAKKDVAFYQKEHDKTARIIKNSDCSISEEAKREFPQESNALVKQFSNIQKRHGKEKYEIDEIDAEINCIGDELAQLDNKTNEIHSKIKVNPHYCDAEYAAASKLVEDYKKNAQKRNGLAEKAKRISCKAKLDAASIENSLNELNVLEENIKALNEKAQYIVEIRQEAMNIKKFINKTVKEIDKKIAEKFMKQQYREILSLSENLVEINDSQTVIQQFKQVEENISLFKSQLEEKNRAFEAERNSTETFLNEIADLMKKDKFYNPMEYYKNKESAESMKLADFLNTYAQGEYLKEIQDGLKEAKKALNNENFHEAKKEAHQIRDVIEKAISYANLKQETILKNIFMAQDIRNVMRNLKYEASASIIDGDIRKGFRITCKVGDEIIDFEKVIIDDEGKVTMDIDHTESVNGTCGVKWTDLQREFAEQGIFVEDVKKNGASVIKKTQSSMETSTKLHQKN